MSIKSNIQAKVDQITLELEANPGQPTSQTAAELQAAAMKAMCGGVDGWVAYMKLFADENNPAELARLIPTDGSHEPEHQIARAYLVRNGMCTDTTTTDLLDNVTNVLNLA